MPQIILARPGSCGLKYITNGEQMLATDEVREAIVKSSQFGSEADKALAFEIF